MLPTCLTHLALGTVTVHGVLETALGNGEEDLNGFRRGLSNLHWLKNHAKRKSRDASVSASEECFDSLSAT